MKMPTSTIGIKGFTLLELLIVVLIIGVLTSVVSLSINAARPSESQILYKSLESQVKLSQKISQLKNLKLRLIINENRSKVEQFDPSTHQWLNASEIQKVQWKDIILEPNEIVIDISPNGQITPVTIKVIDTSKSYLLEIK
jgi:prepilin-type N-terminal cleavage/methylation domain-containing protein